MNWLTDLFSTGASKVVDSIGEAIDRNVTSDQDRLALKNALEQIHADSKIKSKELALQADAEITKRWTSDNEHTITRLVRPLSYAWVVFVFTAIAIGDGNWGFVVRETYIPVFETLLSVMTVAYFGSRGWEKIARTKKQ
jgi:hypothetical protein